MCLLCINRLTLQALLAAISLFKIKSISSKCTPYWWFVSETMLVSSLWRRYLCWINNRHVHFTFILASYRSFYQFSSLALVRFSNVLFLVKGWIIQTSVLLVKSYLLQCYKTHIWQNAYIFASKLATSIHQGLNVTHLSVLVLSNILHHFSIPFGIGLIYNGRIKDFSQRFVMNALCVSSFCNRILDIGYQTSLTSLGCVAVKVHIRVS